jgi:hypothetical protein
MLIGVVMDPTITRTPMAAPITTMVRAALRTPLPAAAVAAAMTAERNNR